MTFKRILTGIILVSTIGNGIKGNAAEPFNRHYIIVVDQTIKSSNPNMGVI